MNKDLKNKIEEIIRNRCFVKYHKKAEGMEIFDTDITLIQESNKEAVREFVQEYSIYLPVSVLDKYLSTKSESNEGEGKLEENPNA